MKAICIDDSPNHKHNFITPNGRIKKGTTYLVEGITEFEGHPPGFILAGLPCLIGTVEVGWRQSRFRLIQDKPLQTKQLKKYENPTI